jgi:hypothetical protein
MLQVCSHSVEDANGTKHTILLEEFIKTDLYATNLELTGQANWFGSRNMCNLLADNADSLFLNYGEHGNGVYSMLELGAGLGRAGLMAVKLLEYQFQQHSANTETTLERRKLSKFPKWQVVLTDGEDEIANLLINNRNLNFPHIAQSLLESASIDSENEIKVPVTESAEISQSNASDIPIACACQQLWWGDSPEMDLFRRTYGSCFDLIIGADLIYGRDEKEDPNADLAFGRDKLKLLLYTVSVLLSCRGATSTAPVTVSTHADASGQDETEGVATTTTITATSAVLPVAPVLVVAAESAARVNPLLPPAPAPASAANIGTGTMSAQTQSRCFYDIAARPAFYLAITRREVLSIEELSEVAAEFGLRAELLDDYTYDIFDNNVDADSMFWRDSILCFTRI